MMMFGPFLGMVALFSLGWLVCLVYANAVVSPLGSRLVYVTSTSRIVYGMSKHQHFPTFFIQVNKKSIPIWCIALNFLVGLFLFLPLSG
ncbi:amino acid permease [Candidatus Coxiella mudrowiae]|uniref:amino acid permease n=1 Tax=Candidatus Coxiella mudrowiae TaxID=2054173 RepID=UPI000661FCD2|nr:amino acid permease [Candidatus Coxiella mudrowiae]